MTNQLTPPADFSLYHARRDLTAKRNAERDPIKRGQINMLIEMLQNYDEARRNLEGTVADGLAAAIDRQMKLMAGAF